MNKKIASNRFLFSLVGRIVVSLATVACFVFSVSAQSVSEKTLKSLLILHTNDIHDHLRPDYDGVGGLPFVSGFINEIRSQRDDIIVLDAGDIAEKGDLVARKTDSELTFKAISRVGYHAWAPGNHDHDYGIPALYRFWELSGTNMLCINLLKEDGTLEFNPSKIFEINGLRVGVIGAIRPRDTLSLNLDETAKAMDLEAKRLKAQTDIIIAVLHMSSQRSAYISQQAPDIDIFISGHTHSKYHEAISVLESGALIVQAGSYADYVGWLELRIDSEAREVFLHDYHLVEMDHLKIQPDLELIEEIRKKELEIAPEARSVIAWAPREIDRKELGYLAAEAFRNATGADVAFNHSAEIIRSSLPAGILDLNAIYRTGGERGHQLIEFELSGSEIQSYLQGLKISEWYRTQWSGFHGTFKSGTFVTDLVPDQSYRVVMPRREFKRRFQRLFKRVSENPEDWSGVAPLEGRVKPIPLDLSWTDAMVQLLRDLNQKNLRLGKELERIREETGQNKQLAGNNF